MQAAQGTEGAEDAELCAICLQLRWAEGAGAVVQLINCGHRFHRGCIAACAAIDHAGQSLSCPLCRTAFGAKAVQQVRARQGSF
eukprot:SAG11_NODE_14909_length_595_cov_1.245968_1_plen_84_part_00